MSRLAFALVVVLLAAPLAHAQTAPAPSEAHAALHTQAVVVSTLYVASGLLGALSTLLVLVAWNDTPGPGTESRDEALAITGMGAGALGGILLVVGIFMDVDRHVRRDALAVSLGPSGLTLRF